jgi:hypothetical protein
VFIQAVRAHLPDSVFIQAVRAHLPYSVFIELTSCACTPTMQCSLSQQAVRADLPCSVLIESWTGLQAVGADDDAEAAERATRIAAEEAEVT